MILNMDCIRDILLTYDTLNPIERKKISQKDLNLDSYNEAEVRFHLQQMDSSNCAALQFSADYNIEETYIKELTNYGETLLEAMKDETVFLEFKEIIDSKYPSYNLEIFVYAYHSFLSTRYGM